MNLDITPIKGVAIMSISDAIFLVDSRIAFINIKLSLYDKFNIGENVVVDKPQQLKDELAQLKDIKTNLTDKITINTTVIDDSYDLTPDYNLGRIINWWNNLPLSTSHHYNRVFNHSSRPLSNEEKIAIYKARYENSFPPISWWLSASQNTQQEALDMALIHKKIEDVTIEDRIEAYKVYKNS